MIVRRTGGAFSISAPAAVASKRRSMVKSREPSLHPFPRFFLLQHQCKNHAAHQGIDAVLSAELHRVYEEHVPPIFDCPNDSA